MKPEPYALLPGIRIILWCFFFLAVSVGITRATDYILGPGDVIRISVYDNDDLLTITRVSDDGMIAMPLLGQIKIEGLTVSQAADLITKRLADGYIINPQINIFIQEFRSKKAIVLGRVNKPGLMVMSGPTTLLELISQAGGLEDDFGETVTIKRKAKGEDNVILVNLKLLTEGGDLSQNIAIQDGDTVYVSKAGMCYVTGEVKSPNAYKCGESMTVLKLITLAGGFTGKASRSGVRIVRMVDGSEQVFEKAAMDMVVQPDDVIIVPESFF
ncbi:MAG: polysaccharide biosynthesis/export family protein [Desulfobulbaceae bacterium]|nr:polysaccharide biosynthesis/export family protein [Desulfobulbaceae bacterium]